jgi:type III pantothenate kinase
MILAIDIGNTTTDFALFQSETFMVKHLKVSSSSFEEDSPVLNGLLEELKKASSKIEGCIVSSVIPSLNKITSQKVSSFYDVNPLFLTWQDCLGINTSLKQPNKIGHDRLANVIGTLYLYGYPSIIIDFGTAITFDVLTNTGDYVGGIIVPGVDLCAESLWTKTAQLPKFKIEKPLDVVGKDTISCMQSGIFYGFKELINGLIKEICTEQGFDDLRLIVTGGGFYLFEGELEGNVIFDEFLTLKGLNIAYERIKRSC